MERRAASTTSRMAAVTFPGANRTRGDRCCPRLRAAPAGRAARGRAPLDSVSTARAIGSQAKQTPEPWNPTLPGGASPRPVPALSPHKSPLSPVYTPGCTLAPSRGHPPPAAVGAKGVQDARASTRF